MSSTDDKTKKVGSDKPKEDKPKKETVNIGETVESDDDEPETTPTAVIEHLKQDLINWMINIKKNSTIIMKYLEKQLKVD